MNTMFTTMGIYVNSLTDSSLQSIPSMSKEEQVSRLNAFKGCKGLHEKKQVELCKELGIE